MKLWYAQQAEIFEEALPIGNGKIGAMVYGGTDQEKLSLNEDTFWSGFPKDKSDSNVKQSLTYVRELMKEGRIKETEEEIWKHMLTTFTESYQPVGDLILQMHSVSDGNVSDYSRELSLDNAEAVTAYKKDEVFYRRTVFCSKPDHMLCIKITADKPQSISLDVLLTSQHPVKITETDGILSMHGNAPAYAAPNYHPVDHPIRYEEDGHHGLSFSASVLPIVKNGTVKMDSGHISIRKADEVILFLNIGTNFENFKTIPDDSKINAEKVCLLPLLSYNQLPYEEIPFDQIRKRHRNDYANLYERVKLELDAPSYSDMPTDTRIKRYLTDHSDLNLPVLMFQYGRYLLIAASREGTQAANLQGIWNESLRAPWSSNYTININLQMNYWLAETCNLHECVMPLMEFVRELCENGKRTASVNYGLNGWCAHHNSDLWRQTEPVGASAPNRGSVGYGYWTQGGSWLIRHVWEYYEFSGDTEFLENYSDIIKGAGEFLLDYATERDGTILFSPTTSPENSYRKDGDTFSVCEMSAMDIGIYKDVMHICIKMCRILDIEHQFAERCEVMLTKIPDFQIGTKGQLLEWDKEYEENEKEHRHLSLLYGFYPGDVINHKDTKDLIPAVKKTMELRGDIATGWGIAWKINVWARLRDGDHAKKVLDHMLTYVDKKKDASGGVYPNLLSAHPPFQIDANYGGAAGIAEMLLQSRENQIDLLPALPGEWKNGRVSGLCARGGYVIDMEWREGKLLNASIYAKKAGKITVVWGEKFQNLCMEEGCTQKIQI